MARLPYSAGSADLARPRAPAPATGHSRLANIARLHDIISQAAEAEHARELAAYTVRCTVDHAALAADPVAFAALRFRGIQDVDSYGPDEPAYQLELRDCSSCRTTISRVR